MKPSRQTNSFLSWLRGYGVTPSWLSWAIGAVVVLSMVRRFYTSQGFRQYVMENWCIGELLINFQGGFVRRGLFGQMVYQLNQLWGISPQTVLFAMSILAYASLCAFFLYKSRRNGVSWWLTFNPCVLGAIAFNFLRKDYLLCCLFIVILYILHRCRPTLWRNFCVTLLVILCLFLHEAFIFWGGAVAILFFIADKPHRWPNMVLAAVMLGVFAVLSRYKGDLQVATAIYNSWLGIVPGNGNPESCGSIMSLATGTGEMIGIALRVNFVSGSMGFFSFVGRFIEWFLTYYLLITFPFMFKSPDSTLGAYDRTNLSAVFLFVAICCLPLSSLLFVDWGRIVQYFFISSLAVIFVIPRARVRALFPQRVISGIEWLNCKILSWLCPTRVLVMIIFLFFSIPTVGYSVDAEFRGSIVGCLMTMLEVVREYI